ncbi:MAG: rhodanese-like domain-containing protein [Sediminibacterium sp.]|jgi:rhodanese-related sulfurtransferase
MKCKFFVSLFAMALFVVACAQNNVNTQNGQQPQTISAAQFKSAIEKPGVQILDVRTAGEFQSGHIQNALQANWNDAKEFQDRTQHLDKSKPVYVYCQAGGRSAAAQSFLTEKGYTVVNLEGGMSNWKMNQLPVEGNANAVQMRVADFDKVIAENKMVLVDIGATWCPPCRKMQPTVDQIKKEQGSNLYFLAVDGGVDMDVMKHLQFESLPTFIIYKNGKEVWRKQGIVAAEEFQKVLGTK